MPRSLSRPSSLIQSVVQAGDSTVRTVGRAMPARSSASSISSAIMFMAGTAGIGRRDRDLDTAVMDLDLAQHAEIGDGQHGDFGIDHLRRRLPGAPAQIGIV